MNKDLWYKKPRSLEWNPRDDTVGWSAWEKQTKKDYPIQYFFREDVRLYFSIMWRRIEDFKYKIQCFFFPKHQEIRKAIPRTWADISSLVVDVNFAMILSFKKEADESFVNWDGTPQHRQFKNWLDSSAHWITVGKPNCESQANTLHPSHPLTDLQKSKSYEELYGELNKMEKLISETDSNILKQMIDYREYMWT
jgi:hypothetical protein